MSSPVDEEGASQEALLVKTPPAKAGDIRDTSSSHALGGSPGGGHGNPLQSSCLENPMDRRALWATVCRVEKSQTRLKRLSMRTAMHWMRKLGQPVGRIWCVVTRPEEGSVKRVGLRAQNDCLRCWVSQRSPEGLFPVYLTTPCASGALQGPLWVPRLQRSLLGIERS